MRKRKRTGTVENRRTLKRSKGAAKPAPLKLNLSIPPILLEGDQPVAPTPSVSPRLASASALPAPAISPGEGVLPEAYGTGRLFLTPRDPHCLCAHWDLTVEQLQHHNSRAAGQHLVLRVYLETVGGERTNEIHVHPESRHWFIHVGRPGVRYAAELGYYTAASQWHHVAISDPVATPADAPPVKQEPPRFARFELETIPKPPGESLAAEDAPSVSSENLPESIAAGETPAVGAVARPGGRPSARKKTYPLSHEASGETAPSAAPAVKTKEPGAAKAEPVCWTTAEEEALWEIITCATCREERPGSAEIAELMRRLQEHVLPVKEVPQPAAVSGPAELAVSSPTGGGLAEAKGFRLSVNAELIVYGATDPGARVSIGGKPIRLRPDGTFSYRFALPDGDYSLPIVATGSHGEVRQAGLSFKRRSTYEGPVAAHPQDPELKPPAVENIT